MQKHRWASGAERGNWVTPPPPNCWTAQSHENQLWHCKRCKKKGNKAVELCHITQMWSVHVVAEHLWKQHEDVMGGGGSITVIGSVRTHMHRHDWGQLSQHPSLGRGWPPSLFKGTRSPFWVSYSDRRANAGRGKEEMGEDRPEHFPPSKKPCLSSLTNIRFWKGEVIPH